MSDPLAIQVWINQTPYPLPASATLADAIAAAQIQPPFAAAVNLQFVPRNQYGQHALHDQDRVELISPITGG
jgi:sulfur carrier protein